MIFQFRILVLYMIWMFIENGNGSRRPLSLGLNCTYTLHDSNDRVYTGHPFLGICDTVENKNTTATLEIYGPGRRLRAVYMFPDAVTPLTTLPEKIYFLMIPHILRFTEDDELKRRMILFFVCPRANDMEFVWSVTDLNNRMIKHGKPDEEYITVEESLPRPILKIYFHLEPHYIILGEFISIFCSTYVPLDGELVLELVQDSNIISMWKVSWESESEPMFVPVVFAMEVKRFTTVSGRRISVLLELFASDELKDSLMRCYAASKDMTAATSIAEDPPKSFDLIELPENPYLSMESRVLISERLWYITANCWGNPPINAGSITVVFRYLNTKVLHTFKYDDVEYEPEEQNFKYVKMVITFMRLRVEGSSTLWVKVKAKIWYDFMIQEATITCFSGGVKRCRTMRMGGRVYNAGSSTSPDSLEEYSGRSYILLVPVVAIAVLSAMLLVMLAKKSMGKKEKPEKEKHKY